MKSFATAVRPLAKLRATWKRMEKSLFKRLPGYGLFRGLTQQLTGKAQDQAWKPALAEIEEALVPAFIIEEHEDGGSPDTSAWNHPAF
jgi:hypothetical protein